MLLSGHWPPTPAEIAAFRWLKIPLNTQPPPRLARMWTQLVRLFVICSDTPKYDET